MVFLDWIRDNWFTLLQSLGIIGGFIFTGLALRIDTKVRRVSNRFEATKQHREIWSLLFSRPDLKRVLDKDADLAAQGVTSEEKLFVNLLLLHLESNYRAAEAGMFALPSELQADIQEFLACPIPRTVWDLMKSLQDKDFAKFVEEHRVGEQ